MITFYCANDSIEIFDLPVRNHGFIPGKFLKKDRYINVNRNNDWFNAGDFVIGSDVTINSHVFTIYEADRNTIKW